jgi:hypothetical protein
MNVFLVVGSCLKRVLVVARRWMNLAPLKSQFKKLSHVWEFSIHFCIKQSIEITDGVSTYTAIIVLCPSMLLPTSLISLWLRGCVESGITRVRTGVNSPLTKQEIRTILNV